MCDNFTAISYVNNMGGWNLKLAIILLAEYGSFVLKTSLVWLSAAYIPGTVNIEADKQSRVLEDATEWKLNPALFQNIVEKFADIDKTRHRSLCY